MKKKLDITMKKQPDDLTCGPTCLHSVYAYFNEGQSLEEVINAVDMLQEGGTLAASLGVHALNLGFEASLYTFNLSIFDPTWFSSSLIDIGAKLEKQLQLKKGDNKFRTATKAYLNFLSCGGVINYRDLTVNLIKHYLLRSVPIIAGLSATYLYRCAREIPETNQYDDVKGEPSGHFVVLTGFDMTTNQVLVSDPYKPNPISDAHTYLVDIDHLICAILLGVVTYDANLLIINPKGAPK